ncbi:MAG: SDR family NAD(P)-dependent oxidoreductase [Myxococcota bacterium]
MSARVALVTGASSGIGRATAVRLARSGRTVLAMARRAERLEELAREYSTLEPVPCDLRSPEDIDRAYASIRGRYGGVDILINAAGLGHEGNLEHGQYAEWKEMLDVNVLALARMSQLAVEDMRVRNDEGHLVHVSSLAGHRVAASATGMYAATKYAVRALAEAQRIELRALDSRIRVSLVSPGFVETEFHAGSMGPRAAEELYRTVSPLSADDIALVIEQTIDLPAHLAVHDVLVRSTTQRS